MRSRSVFLIVDLAFFGANALKIAHGGWVPLRDRRCVIFTLHDDVEDAAAQVVGDAL